MRKWFSSICYIMATLVAIFLLLPLLFGMIAEKKCNQIINIINSSTPLEAKIIDYHRGWFNADATAQISLDKLALPKKELYQVTINAQITHGPVTIDWIRFHFMQAMVDAKINLNANQNQLLKRVSDAAPIATTKIKFRLNGDTNITLDSPALTYQNQEANLNWRGLKIKTTLSPLYNRVTSKIDFSGFAMDIKGYSLHVGEIINTYEGNKTSDGLWLGKRDLQLASLTTKNPNDHTISLSNLVINNSIGSNQENLANIATTITINNININGATYSQNKINLEINKLNQQLLAKLQQQLTSSRALISPTSIGLDMIIAILNNGNEINIKQLETATPWGKLFATIKILFANQPNNIGILAMLANSTININVKTEKALALHLLEKFYQIIPSSKKEHNPTKQAETLLEEWLQSGKILKSNDDNYLHLTLDYKDSQPFINNKLLVLTTKP